MLLDALVVLVFRLTFLIAQYNEGRPTIRLEQGLLSGFKIEGGKNRIDVFLGIPYAAPPIGNRRFTPPQHHSGWNDTLDATNYASPCLQIPPLSDQNEDCLYLNVWAPEQWHRHISKPVVIFFEGIEFVRSNKIPISGQALAMEGVVVVTANYRLNVFGFLCLGIPEARGNLGLLDQYLVLLWVKRNIHRFGGDAEKITLFGYSAGAASAMLHLTSPRTNDLFQRLILSSGSPFSPWHWSKSPFVASRKFATMLQCLYDEPEDALRCMQAKSVYEIIKTYQDYIDGGNPELFLPVVDDFLPETDKYLPTDPVKYLKHGTYVQVPLMVGISKVVVDSQYSEWLSSAKQGPLRLRQYIEQIKMAEIIKRYNFDGANKEQIMELLRWRYMTPSQNNVDSLLTQLIELEFEAKIEAPHYTFLTHLESSYAEPIYAYHIDHSDQFGLNVTDLTITFDILLLFGPPHFLNQIDRRQFNSKELTLSEKFKDGIKNFINFGNPDPKKDHAWKRYAPDDYYVEYFNASKVTTNEVTSRIRKMSFWTQLLPKIAQFTSPQGNIYSKELLNPDPTTSFKHAMYALVGLVAALLFLLAICIFLLRKSYRERERHLHMIY